MMNLTFSDKIYKCLVAKVLKFNEQNDSKISIDQLIRIYKRGEKAADTMWQPQKTTAQSAMARVNMFLDLSAGRKVKGDYRFHDIDVVEGTDKTHQQESADPFWNFTNLDFTSARTDLLLAQIPDSDGEKVFYPPTVEEN
mgnify:FL=1|jgi:hypothetical protein|tara:strand:+ start:19 stop:438 length:420 start_codon:yes stop_codon:yes gene_type:complete